MRIMNTHEFTATFHHAKQAMLDFAAAQTAVRSPLTGATS